MHFTKIISEEIFSPGLPLEVLLPIAGEDSTNKEVGFLIEELHTSGRWPILVNNVSYNMKRYMYTEIHTRGGYIILISGPCNVWEEHILSFWRQLNELPVGENKWNSWNPKAKFIVSVMSDCTHIENSKFSRFLLNELWLKEVMNAAVLFLKSNEHGGNYMQGNTTDSAQGTYLELHTWYPYENSEICNAAEGNITVKVLTVRNLSDIRRSEIFRGYNYKSFQGCPIKVFVRQLFPLVYLPKLVRYNDTYIRTMYEEGIEIEMLKLIGIALNMSLDIAGVKELFLFISAGNKKEEEGPKVLPFIFVGWFPGVNSEMDNFGEYTRSYHNVRVAWYTPCAVRHERWSRFFKIFSVDMWIIFALSLVLAVITVRCISNYAHKSHLQESNSYTNIFSVTTNITAVLLSVSVNTQPRSAPLRLFFFCWVCYSFAISTVFQAYLTTFLIEPGYENPIKTVEEMLNSEIHFGFNVYNQIIFPDTSDPVESAFVKNSVECHNPYTCFVWAAKYHNISTILDDLFIGYYRGEVNWEDENNRPLVCELENGVIRTFGFSIWMRKRSPFFELINNVLSRIIEGGIYMHIKEMGFERNKIQSGFNFSNSYDTYSVFRVSHLQTAFYLLMLGYVLTVACFVTEIMWHRYRSKGRERTIKSVFHRQT
jgi:hypothetical protein